MSLGEISKKSGPVIPRATDLLWPTLQALKHLGGAGTVPDIERTVVAESSFTKAQLAVPHGQSGRQSKIQYRLACARSDLKAISALSYDRATRTWSLTGYGRRVTEKKVIEAQLRWRADYVKKYKRSKG